MGVHVEWMYAGHTSVGIIEAGAMWDGEIVGHESDEDTVNEGNVAVSIGCDTVTIIEGTRAEIERLLQAALDAIRPAVPDFPMPPATGAEDGPCEGDEVTCPHVYTEADAEAVRRANAEHVATMRRLHGDAANISEAVVPEVGKVCGRVMEVQERVMDYRPVHWREAREGSLVISIGDGSYGDGEFEAFVCQDGHVFRPDWDRTDYGW